MYSAWNYIVKISCHWIRTEFSNTSVQVGHEHLQQHLIFSHLGAEEQVENATSEIISPRQNWWMRIYSKQTNKKKTCCLFTHVTLIWSCVQYATTLFSSVFVSTNKYLVNCTVRLALKTTWVGLNLPSPFLNHIPGCEIPGFATVGCKQISS